MSDQGSDASAENIFSETDWEQASRHLIENLFLNKRQEMKVRLLEAENELEPERQPDQLVCLIGEPGPLVHEEPVQPLVSVRNSWLRVHNKKWVLGTTLLNTSQRYDDPSFEHVLHLFHLILHNGVFLNECQQICLPLHANFMPCLFLKQK